MPTNSGINTVRTYVHHLNRICNQVISDCRLVVFEGAQPNRWNVTGYQNGGLHPLTLKPYGCLDIHQEVSVNGGKITVEKYSYRYALSYTPNIEPQWLLRYEYSRNPAEHVPHAHLHIIASIGDKLLGRIHFPTGSRVSIEQIIIHLIYEHNITPRCENWFEVLSVSHQGFLERREDPLTFF